MCFIDLLHLFILNIILTFQLMDFEHILDETYIHLNNVRMRPHQSAQQLHHLKSAYHGNLLKNKIKTREGPMALENLIQDLQRRPQHNNKLKWSFALHLAADEQASVLGEEGILTTEGTRFHKTLPERVKDFAIIKGRITQIYEFGGQNATQILEELLIDDGLVSRKRRNTLLDPIFNYVGIGSSYHEKLGACTVIILAQDIISLVAPQQSGRYKRRKVYEPGQQRVFKNEREEMLHRESERQIEEERYRQSQRYKNEHERESERQRQSYRENEKKEQSLFILEPNNNNNEDFNRRTYDANVQSGINRRTVETNNDPYDNREGQTVTYNNNNQNYQHNQYEEQERRRQEERRREEERKRQEEKKEEEDKKDQKKCVIM